VEGIVIVKLDGSIIRTTYTGENNKAKGEEIAKIVPQLALKARTTVKELDKKVSLTSKSNIFFRMNLLFWGYDPKIMRF